MFKHTFRNKEQTRSATVYTREDASDDSMIALWDEGRPTVVYIEPVPTLEQAIDLAALFCGIELDALHNHINPRRVEAPL